MTSEQKHRRPRARRAVSVSVSLLALAIAGVAVVGLIGRATAAAAKVRLGLLQIATTLPIRVGDEQGFFKQEDLALEMVPISGGAVGIPAMQGGSIDITFADVGTILKAAEQGLKVKILAPSSIVGRDAARDTSHYLAHAESGITSLADAKGKRVAVNLLGNIVHAYTLAALADAGLKPGDYSIVELPYPQMVDALLNKQVDVVYEVEPFKAILMKTGKVRDLGSTSYKVHQNLRIAGYATTERWLAEHGDAARRFQRAALKSARFTNASRNQFGEWYVRFFRLSPALKDDIVFEVWEEDLGDPYVASLTKTRDILLAHGFLKTKVDPEALLVRPR